MNINLFYNSRYPVSPTLLAGYISEHSPNTVRLYNENTVTTRSSIPHIRWGVTFGRIGAEVNSMDVIRNSTRLAFSSLLKEGGVSVLEYHNGIPNSIDYPVVVRTLLNSSEGKGIVICRNDEEFLPYRQYKWSRFVKFRSEFGVHVIEGRIVKKFKKVAVSGNEIDFPIRNTRFGYRFRRINGTFPKLTAIIESSINIIPMEFGRYDVGWSTDDRKWYMIEANTAPSLSQNTNTLSIYGDYFIRKFNRN